MLKNLSNNIFHSLFSCSRLFILLIIINSIVSIQLFGDSSEKKVGKKTGLELPRFVSIKVDEAYLRRGPSFDHKIDWIYKRKNLPMKIINEFEHWRKVEDFEGHQGWMHKSLFSRKRYIIVNKEETLLRNKNSIEGLGKALLMKNVIAKVHACKLFWCFVEINRFKGWVVKENIWGVKKEEIF